MVFKECIVFLWRDEGQKLVLIVHYFIQNIFIDTLFSVSNESLNNSAHVVWFFKEQNSSNGFFFGILDNIYPFTPKKWFLFHLMQFSMKNPICCIFILYAAIMQHYAAAEVFSGILDNSHPFLFQNKQNNDFQSIWTNNQRKIQYAAFWTCMLQVCSSMLQRWFFRVFG